MLTTANYSPMTNVNSGHKYGVVTKSTWLCKKARGIRKKLASGLKMTRIDSFFSKIWLIFNNYQKRLNRHDKPGHMVTLGKKKVNISHHIIANFRG